MAIQKHPSGTKTQSAPGGRRAAALAPARPAIFLDRDGTLIEEKGYLSEPSQIALLPGVLPALARLRDAGFALVLVTNQSAIGRGWLSAQGLEKIHTELERQLEASQIKLDAIYSCPDFDDAARPPAQDRRAHRKPGAGMLFRAALDLGLDLSVSWMIGDHARDLMAGHHAGCRGNILVLTGHGEEFKTEIQAEDTICQDLPEAALHILGISPLDGESPKG